VLSVKGGVMSREVMSSSPAFFFFCTICSFTNFKLVYRSYQIIEHIVFLIPSIRERYCSAWLSDSTSIGAISYLVMQPYKYTYHRNFRTVHQQNTTLHVGTYALLLSDRFLHILTATPTLSQDGRTLTVKDTQIQVFNKLQGKLQDVLKAVKAIVAAWKKGSGKSGAVSTNADGMDGE
jgi:hypothetical protein